MTGLIESDDGVDIDIEDIREDFQHIWSKNLSEAILVKQGDSQAGEYFREDEDSEETNKKILLNVQGIGAFGYKRARAGIVTTEERLHAYALHNEDIENKDRIIWNKKTYIVENHDGGIHDGQFGFQEFDMKRVDKVD